MISKLVILTLVVLVQAASTVRQSPSKIGLRDCDVQNVQGKAKCGTLQVYEDRAGRKGRMIDLNIIVLPATGDKSEPDPIVYFAGGPGSAATEDAAGIAQLFAKLHEHRDLLFVDQRGTGGSNPLNCDLYDPADLQSYLARLKRARQSKNLTRS
jgi:pimeloyl-ACP methyl ester carboxylesterase